MKYPTMKFVFDRKKVATKTKKGLVQIEVTSEGKRKWIGTSVKVYADQWNEKRKVVNSVNSIQLNAILDGMMAKLNEFILELVRNNQQFDFDKLNAFLEKSTRSDSFIEFVRKRIEDRTDLEDSTRKQHRTLLQSLEKFGKINYMDDLTKANITLYYEYVLSTGVSKATAYNYLKRIKVYIGEAIRFGILDSNPTEGLKFERGKSKGRKYLDSEELKKMVKCKLPTNNLNNVKDVFLFMCMTGLSYSDMSKFNFKRDVIKKNGKFMFEDKRQKTKEKYFIVLLPMAISILKKYDYSLPVIANQNMNIALKTIAAYAGINKQITSHYARHTAAMLALNNGVPIETVSKMLGHSNIRTTQIYANMLNDKVEDAYDIVESVWGNL